MPTMKSFAENFFSSFGARFQPQGDEWVVDLPPDLAEAFGKSRLYLVFPPAPGQGEMRELSPTEDLLVYGSRTFDQMLALLESRGEAVCLRWPPKLPPVGQDGELSSPLPLRNCRILVGEVRSGQEPFYIFNFRAVYLSDEKQELFMNLVLDAEGEVAPAEAGQLTEAEPLSPDDPDFSVEPETMRRMLEQAEAIARSRVVERAAELQQEIRPRLEKALLRLTGYYRRLTGEVDTGDESQDETVRAELQQDLARKIGDELERHQLRVTLTPLNYAIALAPFAHYRLTLTTGHTSQTINLKQNRHTGQVDLPDCHHCREPVDRLALCDRQHIVHAHCLATCRRCHRDICLACGIEACAICGGSVCGECVAACLYCGRWLCAEHVSTCAICGAAHCSDHAALCRWCGQSYCQACVVGPECETCRRALTGLGGDPPPLPALTASEIGRYRWFQAANQAFVIYIGRPRGPLSGLRSWLIIVTDQAGNLLVRRTVGAWQRIFG